MAHDEVVGALWKLAENDPEAAEIGGEGLLASLEQRRLLFRLPGGPVRYRTRVAEGLRLAATLRQSFAPRNHRPGSSLPDRWWEQGRRLVADYRLHVAERRYPKRNIAADEAIAEMAQVPGWTDLHAEVARSQIGTYALSRFQVDATKAVLHGLQATDSRGIVVSAGTGSGKTLAFYLPDYAALAHDRRRNAVHTLALYPRVELLRDQLRDAVTGNLRLLQQGLSAPRIGVLYAKTPWEGKNLTQPDTHRAGTAWPVLGDGFVCPYLGCPSCDGGQLIWSRRDIAQQREVLRCAQCQRELPEKMVALTRQSLCNDAPKLLFTTTEMLNRASAGSMLGRVLGWVPGAGPRVVLLDEVHTHSGATGAQTALLLRRWRHARRAPVTFVGLSATLRHADQFMAQLTGLESDKVTLIEPHPTDLESEGREYALALRGDPVSGVSLLSVAIQTAMLQGRLLDSPTTPLRQSLHGSRGFLFTDDLDVTNRLYDDLRDAEGGQNGRQGRRKRDKPVLAALRSPDLPAQDERYAAGQSWNLPEQIGHHLSADLSQRPLLIGRTSSQDAGVDAEAHLVVATASLEVGFNDPRVGMVLQHKAPHDAASFLQRRGRAGRERGTRPLTVVTLSDFGRDRLAYQGYDALFSPEVAARTLPLTNRHIIKIQGAQALVDWLGIRLRQQGLAVDARSILTGTADPAPSEKHARARHYIVSVVASLSDGDDALLAELTMHLQRALALDDDGVLALLWEQPRSLMLAVAPTIVRRLLVGGNGAHNDAGAAPAAFLPEFITRSLFDPLNLPEVEFDLPFPTDNEERLPVGRALAEAVPGRVSRRFGYQSDRHRTWLEVPAGAEEVTLDLEGIVKFGFPQGQWNSGRVDLGALVVMRPHTMSLAAPPDDVASYSQGRPLWASEFVHNWSSGPTEATVPDLASWQGRIAQVGFATHAAGNPIEVRRMTYGAECDIARGTPAQRERVSVRYALDGEAAAMGFASSVDALQVRVAALDVTAPRVVEHLCSPKWRTKAFTRIVAEDPRISAHANVFQRGWLALVYLAAFALRGLHKETPQTIHAALAGGAWRDQVPQIIRMLYRQDPTGSGAQAAGSATDRVTADLESLSQQPDVAQAMDEAGALLFSAEIASVTADLARRAYRDTLAAAILEAVLRTCPDSQDGDVTIDVVAGSNDVDTIWISETSEGGLGIVESLAYRYGEDPARFWALVAAALRPNAYEYTDRRLTDLLRHVVAEEPGGDLAQAMTQARAAQSAGQAGKALEQVRRAWAVLDGTPRHADVAALATRLLRPGSDRMTDAAAWALIQAWDGLEEALGIEVDARVVAYTAGAGELPLPRPLTSDQAFSMLWPRGDQARNHHLESYQPYRDGEQPAVLDRLLVAAVHAQEVPRIKVTSQDWVAQYQKMLAQAREVELALPLNQPEVLRAVMLQVPLVEVDRGVMRLYGEVTQVSRDHQYVLVRAVIKESEQ
ncbi:protein DpdJ [Streptomyces sp. NBC_01788]|uniref:protein DpdJ n=1 Tax=Streptomyces sp. NBC_01788 TaxID=2975940 RepID=UPI002DD935C1|nr:protein DpdJ [Streptomyces sp. NBC_01788]WSB24510.1 protein DpdJ [Streptomyces sp. NBC_01788]